MENHEIIFEKIKELLYKVFPNEIIENKDEKYLSIRETGIWIMSDSRELTVGYGMTHIHCDPRYDDLNEVVELFFNLLTMKKKITHYLKGRFPYKHKTSLTIGDDEIYNLGTAMTWFFPFWKRTTTKVEYQDEIIELSEIENEVNEIKNWL
ncbi:hypothetical protein GM418_13865 [Maribellus comscasis]|uniref:Uncharacterized protein n=1 Tax=Maribellus comscasis TaxID=2681766 RepID=A0A6I6K011_9BACT|nr:hypothetical protein [Maribellus comscasis]QGY44713.1 hypothetical protein GM418_13865 [Maribellus comscasis]